MTTPSERLQKSVDAMVDAVEHLSTGKLTQEGLMVACAMSAASSLIAIGLVLVEIEEKL